MAAQHEDGLDWCYYIRANQNRRPYELAIKCCSSSGPRALEMFARYLVGEIEGGVSFTSLVPCSVVLPESLGGAKVKVTGNYPFNPNVTIRFDESSGKEFALEFRDPADSQLKVCPNQRPRDRSEQERSRILSCAQELGRQAMRSPWSLSIC